MRGLRWYAARLGAMSPSEIASRLADSARTQGRRLAPPRPFTAHDLREQAWRLAASGPRRPIRFFGVEIDFPAEKPDWARDYRTGRRAPLVFYGDVDYRDERVVGDSKYTWELNRHQFLVPWAVEAAETGDDSAAAAVVALVLDWIASNPRHRGINWISSLEHALRILSWGLALEACGDRPIPRAARPHVLGSVAEQADFVRHTPSRHSSANNHLLGELVGLLAAGVFFPDAPRTAAHARAAAPLFVAEMRRQNFADGVNREQAVYYHHYVAEYLLVGMRLLERLGLSVPDDLPPLAHRMLRFVDATTDDAGTPLPIGDTDDGVVTGLNLGSGVGPFESLLWAGWVAHGDPACGAHATRIARAHGREPRVDRRTAYWHGTAPPPRPENEGERRFVFPDGGYVVRQDAGTTLAFRAGPFGYPSIGAHAHCDQLSVLLRVGDGLVLTDSGTGVYHTDEPWRRYFRGTSAHNTVRVDGLDQAEYGGPFLWATHADGRLRVENDEEGRLQARGSHDGYRRLADPVSHERRIEWRRGLGLRVEDACVGEKGPHLFELFWNLGPEVEAFPHDLPAGSAPFFLSLRLVRRGQTLGTLVLACDLPARTARHKGDTTIPAGFDSPRYRVFRPIEQIVVRAEGRSCRFTTLVLASGVPLEEAAREGWA